MKTLRIMALVSVASFVMSGCITMKSSKAMWPCEQVAIDDADCLRSFGIGISMNINFARSKAQEIAMQNMVDKMVTMKCDIQKKVCDSLRLKYGKSEYLEITSTVEMPTELFFDVGNAPSKNCEEIMQKGESYYCCMALELPKESAKGILLKSLESGIEYDCGDCGLNENELSELKVVITEQFLNKYNSTIKTKKK